MNGVGALTGEAPKVPHVASVIQEYVENCLLMKQEMDLLQTP